MNEEQEIKQLYRDHLKREILSQDLSRQKRHFIHAHFSEGSFSGNPFGILAPAFALGLLFFVFLHWQVRPARSPGEVSVSPAVSNQADSGGDKVLEPGTSVRRLSSQVGATMVYQKSYGTVPVTIIWVFPGGSS